jgi:hypothetical protein
VRKEVVSSPEVVFCQLPALQHQIPGRRRWGEEGGRLLSITCSPVPDFWVKVAGEERGRLLLITCFPVPDSWRRGEERGCFLCQLPALQLQIPGWRWRVRNEVVFCQLPALQFQIPGRRRRGKEGGRLLSITCSPVPDSWEEVAG